MKNKVFKEGDKVVVNTSEFNPYICREGDILIVKDNHEFTPNDCLGGLYLGWGYIDTHWLNACGNNRFKEYEELETFDLKNSTWFISVKNANELSAVAKWLEQFGIKPQFSGNWIEGIDCIVKDVKDCNYFFRANLSDQRNRDLVEVKVEFETTTVVKNVEYLKSEKQKRIEELEKELLELTEELEVLKNE